MAEGRARHMYPGGNTHLGFFSYYSYIISQEEAEKIYVIKGGPGVGKSTFMRKIGDEVLRWGLNVEFMHCSSDNNSLDGIVIPALKTAFIDGTAPHVVDPKNPGAVDEIINFGDYWNEKGMKKHRPEIIKAGKEIGRLFGRAYKYLKAAHSVYEDSADIYGRALLRGILNARVSRLEEELFAGAPDSFVEGGERRLFAGAITPEGCHNYLDNLLDVGRVYEIRGGMGTGEEAILERLKATARRKGFDLECYYCALNPKKLEHIIIPGLDAAVTTSNSFHSSSVTKKGVIDVMDYMDEETITACSDDLDQNLGKFVSLMDVAVDCIRKAKAAHDRLETYYIPNVDFDAIDYFFKSTIERLKEKLQ
jgi:hypothetical protein